MYVLTHHVLYTGPERYIGNSQGYFQFFTNFSYQQESESLTLRLNESK